MMKSHTILLLHQELNTTKLATFSTKDLTTTDLEIWILALLLYLHKKQAEHPAAIHASSFPHCFSHTTTASVFVKQSVHQWPYLWCTLREYTVHSTVLCTVYKTQIVHEEDGYSRVLDQLDVIDLIGDRWLSTNVSIQQLELPVASNWATLTRAVDMPFSLQRPLE